MQTRVLVYDQIRQHDRPNEWCLYFQRVRYVYETGEKEDGFRFIWMRPDGTLQAARGQARIPSLATALWFIHEGQNRGWEAAEIVGEQVIGLQMIGLSDDMQGICQDIYGRFIERHGLKQWPLKITLQEREPVPNTPRQYSLEIVCGIEGQDATWTKRVTISPEFNLQQTLDRQLEIHYEYKKKGVVGMRHVETMEGRGTVTSNEGKQVPVHYELHVYQKMIPVGSHGNPNATIPGMMEIRGSVQPVCFFGQNGLMLQMQDGRKLNFFFSDSRGSIGFSGWIT